MEISAIRDEQQKESQAKPLAKDVSSESENLPGSADRGNSGRALRKNQHAAQKLARKKRLKAAHRRRLKASHTKG